MSGPTFVLDGSNLAWLGPGDGPALAAIDAIVEALRVEWVGAQIIVVVDASLRHRLSAADKAEHQRRANEGALVEAPADEDADAYILAAAKRLGGCVVTRDLYRDRREARAGLPMIRPALIGGAVILGEPKMFVGVDGDRSVGVAPETLGEHTPPNALPGAAPLPRRSASDSPAAPDPAPTSAPDATTTEDATTTLDGPADDADPAPAAEDDAPLTVVSPADRRRTSTAQTGEKEAVAADRTPPLLPTGGASALGMSTPGIPEPDDDAPAASEAPSRKRSDRAGATGKASTRARRSSASASRASARRSGTASKRSSARSKRSSAGAKRSGAASKRSSARSSTPTPIGRTAFGAALLIGIAALSSGAAYWALADEAPPPVYGPLFVRGCHAWQLVDGVETIVLHAPPETCITGVAHHPPARHVATIIEREGDDNEALDATHGALRVVAFEDGTPIADHRVAEGIDRTEDGVEITVHGRLVDLSPDGSEALLHVQTWTGDARSDVVTLWHIDEGVARGTRPAIGAAWLDEARAMVTANPCPTGCGRLLAVPAEAFDPPGVNKRPRPTRTGHTWAGPVAVAPDGRVALARAFDDAAQTAVLVHTAHPAQSRPEAPPQALPFAARHAGQITQLTWRDDGLWMSAQGALYHIDPDAAHPRWQLMIARVDTAGARW